MQQEMRTSLPQKRERFSGIELLKIFSMLVICLFHAVQVAGVYSNFNVSENKFNAVFKLLGYSAPIANYTFVACSAWFLLDSKKAKGEKAIGLLLDSMCISIVILLGFLCAGRDLNVKLIVKQIFPDIFKNNWFIPAYVIFYCVHPLLNIIIRNITPKAHLLVAISSLFLFFVLNFFGLDMFNSSIIDFCSIYFIIAYLKNHMMGFTKSLKYNLLLLILGLFVFSGAVLAHGKILVWTGFDYGTNIICLFIVITLVNLFNMMKFKNKVVNYISSCTLFIYLIHENSLLRNITRFEFYEYVIGRFGIGYFNWFVLLCGVGMFVGALLLSLIYKNTLHRITTWLAVKIKNVLSKILNWLDKKIVKSNDDKE